MSRPVRMSGAHISAKLNEEQVRVANLSLTGALLQLDEPLPVDTVAVLLLARHPVQATLRCKVIRSTQVTHSSGWMVAVTFINPTREARSAIPQMMGPSRGR